MQKLLYFPLGKEGVEKNFEKGIKFFATEYFSLYSLEVAHLLNFWRFHYNKPKGKIDSG